LNAYVVTFLIFGAVVLLTVWLPMALSRLPLSLPICCLAIGMLLAWSPFTPRPAINPLENIKWAEHLTEFVLIVALMGAGLKIDRPLGLLRWSATWRLLGIAMPLSIGAIALVGWSVLGLGLASSILLGAALAPTDPVLASDVQVGPPQTGEEDSIRFSLTSEAGLNDGLSFPFVMAAIAIAGEQPGGGFGWLPHWFAFDVVWKLAAGVAMGWVVGSLLGYLTFRMPEAGRIARTGDGLAALGFTCIAYGATEIVHGYGFVGVFVAALTLRSVERKSEYHGHLHDFGEQIERLLMMVLLVCFGLAYCRGRSSRARRRQTGRCMGELDRLPAAMGGQVDRFRLRHPRPWFDLLSRLRVRQGEVRKRGDGLGDSVRHHPSVSRHAWRDGNSGHALD